MYVLNLNLSWLVWVCVAGLASLILIALTKIYLNKRGNVKGWEQLLLNAWQRATIAVCIVVLIPFLWPVLVAFVAMFFGLVISLVAVVLSLIVAVVEILVVLVMFSPVIAVIYLANELLSRKG